MAPEQIQYEYKFPICAEHAARLQNLEQLQDQHREDLAAAADKLDSLKNWLLGVLATSVLSLLGIVWTLLRHGK
jgi:hypothetical protein